MINKIPKDYTIETEKFLLRIPNETDFPHIFSATRFPGFNDGMLWEPPQNENELIEPFKNGIIAWEQHKAYGFTIVKKESDQLLGRISIRKTTEEHIWNVGFWTHPEVQGQGIMTEALNGILNFGFEKLSAKRIEACYAIWNKSSEKVLTRNGMTFIKYIEKGFQKNGKWIDENLVAIDKETWDKIA